MSFQLKPVGTLFLTLTLSWSQAGFAEHRFSLPSGQRYEPQSEIERQAYTDVQEGETLLWLLESEGRKIVVEESFHSGSWERKLHVIEDEDEATAFDSSSKHDFGEWDATPSGYQIIQPEEEGAWKEFIHGTLSIPEGLGVGLGSLSFETDRLRLKAGFRLPPRHERDPEATWIEVIRAEVGFTIKI